jgi:hypothetical protein
MGGSPSDAVAIGIQRLRPPLAADLIGGCPEVVTTLHLTTLRTTMDVAYG